MAALASPHSDDGIDAAGVLAVLGHKLRLNIWRNLVPHGAAGLTAGAIAAQLEVGGSALSFHLQQMAKAGVLTLRHDRRYTFYSANSEVIQFAMHLLVHSRSRRPGRQSTVYRPHRITATSSRSNRQNILCERQCQRRWFIAMGRDGDDDFGLGLQVVNIGREHRR